MRRDRLPIVRSMDTTVEAHAVQVAAFRAMGGGQRIMLAFQMEKEAKAISIAGIRARHPDLDGEGVTLAWLRLLHGDEVVDRIISRC